MTAGYVLPEFDTEGKQIVVPAPSSKGLKTWFAGAGDVKGPPVLRGAGQRIRLTWDAAEARSTKNVEWSFAEPVELHDGELFYTPAVNWNCDDIADFLVVLPATATTANGSGTGNCNKVPTGAGYNVIVPAADNGAYDVNLANAVPIPTNGSGVGTGYWDANIDTGVITPSASPGAAGYHLLDVEIKNAILKNVPLGNPLGVFDVETYKVEWMHPNWKLRLTVSKNSAGAGDVAGWLMIFRKSAQV
jgi:hypothetical protein